MQLTTTLCFLLPEKFGGKAEQVTSIRHCPSCFLAKCLHVYGLGIAPLPGTHDSWILGVFSASCGFRKTSGQQQFDQLQCAWSRAVIDCSVPQDLFECEPLPGEAAISLARIDACERLSIQLSCLHLPGAPPYTARSYTWGGTI